MTCSLTLKNHKMTTTPIFSVVASKKLLVSTSHWVFKRSRILKLTSVVEAALNILVTGGSGFVGNNLVRRLKRLGHDVTSFDRTKYSGLRADVNEVFGDLTDSYAVDCYVREHDYVFNIGGMLGTQETIDNPLAAIHTNIIGAVNVFNSLKRHNKRATHITVGNYWMNNPYSITKSTSERFALMYNKEHKTKITICRGFNIYGPGQKPFPVKKVIPNFIIPALRGEKITIYGSGKSEMDMIYVDDATNILACTMKDHGCYDKILDVGTGIAPTVNEIASIVIRKTESKSEINHVDMRPGEDAHSKVCADTTLIEDLLEVDTRELRSFAEGSEPTIEYYRDWTAKHYHD